jgi:hypothetical protein
MKITFLEILNFWCKWALVQLLYVPFVILSITLFPLAYLFRYHIGWDLFWILLNDTEDGDFGAEWWLKREGLTEGFFTAWLWTIRNPAWNYHSLVKPEWTGEYTDVRTIKNTFNTKNPLLWASHEIGFIGTNHVYYRVNGEVYGRFSWASKTKTFQAGTNGKRYQAKWRI